MNKIDINKSVPSERWLEFFDQFADGNRGRHISIEILSSELGDEELIQNAPLMAMVYDPPKKGNKLTIRQSRRFANETGKDEFPHILHQYIETSINRDQSVRKRAQNNI